MTCPSATADAYIHEDAVAPYAYRFTVTSSVWDLSTVTAGVIKVKRSDGTTIDTWTTTLENQTATSIDLVHTFVSGDVDDPELLITQPHLTIPSGELVAAPKTLRVRPEFT